jgi:hypothetical protein
MQSLPVVIIRCEENEIYQLDFRIETDNIRCFILLSGLRNNPLDFLTTPSTPPQKNLKMTLHLWAE